VFERVIDRGGYPAHGAAGLILLGGSLEVADHKSVVGGFDGDFGRRGWTARHHARADFLPFALRLAPRLDEDTR
jgi:hypothetical protein